MYTCIYVCAHYSKAHEITCNTMCAHIYIYIYIHIILKYVDLAELLDITFEITSNTVGSHCGEPQNTTKSHRNLDIL